MRWVDLLKKSLYISLGKEPLWKSIYKWLNIHKISFLLILQIKQDHWNLQWSIHYMYLEGFHSCLLIKQSTVSIYLSICLPTYLPLCMQGCHFLSLLGVFDCHDPNLWYGWRRINPKNVGWLFDKLFLVCNLQATVSQDSTNFIFLQWFRC